MPISELSRFQVNDFSGPQLRLEVGDVLPPNGLLAYNCEFGPGQVSTRKGFAQVWNPNEPINSMCNWIVGISLVPWVLNYLLYYNPTSGKVRAVQDMTNPSPFDVFTLAGCSGFTWANAGAHIYMAGFNSSGVGVGQCRVWDGLFNGGNPAVDKAFVGPLTAAPALSETGSGLVTAGAHRVGYVIQTRSGFVGKICPEASAGGFDITSAITASGGQKIAFALTATWPDEAQKIYPVMTAVDNPNRYIIVPNLEATVVGGTSTSVNFTIDISDEDLVAAGDAFGDVTDNELLLAQDSGGTGPFNPAVVFEFGSRMVYLAFVGGIWQAFFSEPDNYQQITADRHLRTLPGFRIMTAGSALGKTAFIFGPNWTYAFQDNGGWPVTWLPPTLIDGSIGTPSPRGVTINGSSGIGWVAHTTGLYLLMEGRYATRPVSYYDDPTWKRINWAGGGINVQVIDDKDKQRVYVLAPLDAATANSHIIVYDYSNGLTPEDVKASLWNITDYSPGAACIVQNASTKLLELWVGKATAGAVGRQMGSADAAPWSDFGGAVSNWAYECALLPGLAANLGTIYHHYACQVRGYGHGSLADTIYGLDRTKNVAWTAPVTLSATPGGAYTKRFDRLRSESASHRFTLASAAAGDYCILSGLDHYYRQGPAFR